MAKFEIKYHTMMVLQKKPPRLATDFVWFNDSVLPAPKTLKQLGTKLASLSYSART